mgnify:CR=1 FL=1
MTIRFLEKDINSANGILKLDSSGSVPVNLFTGGNFTDNVSLEGQFALKGALTPTTLTTTTHNYNPPGLATCNFLRLSASTNISLSGIQAPSPTTFQVIFLINIGSGNILLIRNNPGSLSANQFKMNNDQMLNTNEGVVLIYDAIVGGWRCVGTQI